MSDNIFTKIEKFFKAIDDPEKSFFKELKAIIKGEEIKEENSESAPETPETPSEEPEEEPTRIFKPKLDIGLNKMDIVLDLERTLRKDLNWKDELTPEAWEIIKESNRARLSFIQRKLRIGYNRAAAIMDELHAEGYIGPDLGSSTDRSIVQSLQPDEIEKFKKLQKDGVIKTIKINDKSIYTISLEDIKNAPYLFKVADFSYASLKDKDISGLDLSWAKGLTAEKIFSAANLKGVTLPPITLSKISLQGKDIEDVDFSNVSFKNEDISGLDLSRAKGLTAEKIFSAANLKGVTLPPITLSKISLQDKDIEDVDFSNVSFKNEDISGLDLSDAKGLSAEKIFSAANLKKVTLPEIDMSKISLQGKDLEDVDFSITRGLSAKNLLSAENIDGVYLPDGIDFSNISFKDKNISNIDFSDAKGLTYEQLLETECCVYVKLPSYLDYDELYDKFYEMERVCWDKEYLWIRDERYASYSDLINFDIGTISEKRSKECIDWDEEVFDFDFDNKFFNALVGGMTGSGKTILLHAIICNLIQGYSPEEVKLVLMDYKEGVEFMPYKDLPHLLAISLGSKAKFGCDILKKMSEEIESRGALFRGKGVKDFGGYNAAAGAEEKLPRIVMIIDEFQRLLKDETYGDEAKTLLEDIIRRGRAFGINIILSTQTLMDFPMTQATLQQIAIRICLKLSEEDSARFLSDSNLEPSTFTQSGEALFNNDFGNKQANKKFKVFYYSESMIKTIVSNVTERTKELKLSFAPPHCYIDNSPIPLGKISLNEGRIALMYEMGIPPTITKIKAGKEHKIFVAASESQAARLASYIEMLKFQYERNGFAAVCDEADEVSFEDMTDPKKVYFLKITDDCDCRKLDFTYFNSKDSIKSDIIFYTTELSVYKKLNDLSRDFSWQIFMDAQAMRKCDVYYSTPVEAGCIILDDRTDVKTGLLITK